MRWSVLIPVFLGPGERFLAVLRRVLRAYTRVEGDFELVLCCDGPDERVARVVREQEGLPSVRVFEQNRAGQSAATNRATAEARGELLLFSAQDIVPDPRLLAEHERAQHVHRDQMVLGSLPYPAELSVTPFMDFLIHGGPQFAYDRFTDGEAIPPYCLYAPNFSVRAGVFRSLGGFLEDLPYACQDSELGLRFAASGGSVFFHAAAVGYHWHVQTLETYLPRQELAGCNTVRLLELHPRHRKLDWLREKVLEYYLPVAPRLTEYHARLRRLEADPRGWKAVVEHSPVGPYEQDALWFLYDRITKCHFYRGVHDALAEREPDWLTREFASWRIPGPEPVPRFEKRRAPLAPHPARATPPAASLPSEELPCPGRS